MNQPESTTVIAVLTVAMLLVAADIIVRLVLLPARREKFLRELLDHLVESEAETEPAGRAEAAPFPAGDLHECLLRYFEKSGTSREILNTLAGCDGLTQRELASALNRALAAKGKTPLPLAVTRRVVLTLVHAGLLELDRSVLQITRPGQNLIQLLQTRKQTGRARSALTPVR